MKVCKICGIEYPYCRTNRPLNTPRWQDVACSPEHAALYFEKVLASRSDGTTTTTYDNNSSVEYESPEDFDIGLIDDDSEEW